MKGPPQNWYAAGLLVKITVAGEKEKKPLFDRQLRLIRASSHEQAYKAARHLGKDFSFSYKNPNGKLVRWRFAGLWHLDVIRQSNLSDGVEVFSSLERGDSQREIPRKNDLDIFKYETTKNQPIRGYVSPRWYHYAPVHALARVARRKSQAAG